MIPILLNNTEVKMTSKRDLEVSHKVEEIKRMQKNWLDQRASVSQTVEKSSSETRSRGNSSRKGGCGSNKPPTKPETLAWVVGTGPKKKPSSMRARSASPARSTNAARQTSGASNTRPLSGRTNTGGKPSSSGRPPASTRPVSSRSDSGCLKKAERPTEGDRIASKGRLTHAGSEPLLYHSQQNESYSASARNKANGKIKSVSSKQNTDQWDFSSGRPDSQSEKSTKTVTQSGTSLESFDQSHNRYGESFNQSEAQTGELMANDAFDKLADQIACRVRADLKQERSQMMASVGFTGKSVLEDEDERNGPVSSHKCSKCKQLMVSPDHTPYVLIPCAHTLCEACAEERIKCPTCRTKVTSTAVNVTLQQVITASVNSSSAGPLSEVGTQRYDPADYSNSSKSATKTKDSQLDVRSLHPAYESSNTRRGYDQSGAESQSSGRRRISPQEQAEKYLNDYQNLAIRCEAVENEEKEILASVERKNREIAKQKKQVTNIINEQDRLRGDIQKLEERIAALDSHRREYEQQCEDLEEDKREETERLSMVRDMLRGLERGKEKVKMLARNYSISLD